MRSCEVVTMLAAVVRKLKEKKEESVPRETQKSESNLGHAMMK